MVFVFLGDGRCSTTSEWLIDFLLQFLQGLQHRRIGLVRELDLVLFQRSSRGNVFVLKLPLKLFLPSYSLGGYQYPVFVVRCAEPVVGSYFVPDSMLRLGRVVPPPPPAPAVLARVRAAAAAAGACV